MIYLGSNASRVVVVVVGREGIVLLGLWGRKAMDGWMVYCTVHSLMALFVLLLILGAIYKAIAICFMGSHFPTVSNKRYSFPTR